MTQATQVRITQPLRAPDTSDQNLMGRRGWWLLALNFLIPGSTQVLAGNRKLGRFALGSTLLLWAGLIGAAVWFFVARQSLVRVGTNSFVLLLLQLAAIAYVTLWVVLTIDTLRTIRLVSVPPVSRLAIPLVALLVLSLAGYGAIKISSIAGSTRDVLQIFQPGPPISPVDGYYNVLLLGADSGDGRDSMRFDSISVVSMNASTGAVTIFGIPRDMVLFPFSEDSPMRVPDLVGFDYRNYFEGHADEECGWGGGINQLTNAVEFCRPDMGVSLYPNAERAGSRPAIEATKDAAEGILGIEIPNYVFVDMHTFADLVDALGGVDINVIERLPKGGGPAYDGQPAEDWAIGWIEPGQQHMDGDTAQWYARSRYTTNDWDRMRRQRELQQAILAQFTPMNILTRFEEVAASGTAMLSTDLPVSQLSRFFDLVLKAKEQPVTTIELVPDNGIGEVDPDYAYIHQLVHDALYPPVTATQPGVDDESGS